MESAMESRSSVEGGDGEGDANGGDGGNSGDDPAGEMTTRSILTRTSTRFFNTEVC